MTFGSTRVSAAGFPASRCGDVRMLGSPGSSSDLKGTEDLPQFPTWLGRVERCHEEEKRFKMLVCKEK